MPARSQSRSYNPVPTEPDFDTLSTDTTDSLREQVRQVHQQLDEVQKEVLKSRGEVGESSKGGSPFTLEMQAKPLSATFRLPALEPYDGSGDPTEHIAAFRAQMALYDTSDALMYRAFPTTLRGSARTWFFWSLIERPPATLPEMLQRAHQYMAAETLIGGNSPVDIPRHHPRGGKIGRACCQPDPPRSPSIQPEQRSSFKYGKGGLKAPSPMKSHPERRDKRRYYRFHREYRHDTEECHDLQYQIEDLIRRGHLRRYIHEPSLPDGRPPRDSSPRPQGPVEKQIDVIFGGPASGGNSSSARKTYARSE
ncbi:hypothetical protein GW17_00062130, partial [Ensete ventricosum]